MKISLLFFRRHLKLYSRHFMLTFLSIMIVCSPAIGGAIFDKITIASYLNAQSNDSEISYNLHYSYTSTNISDLKANLLEFSEFSEQWNKYFAKDSEYVISEYIMDNQSFLIGIHFSENSTNQINSDLSLNQFDYFSNNIPLENFLVNTEMPFGLSLIFSYNFLQTLNLTTFCLLSEESYIGQTIDFNTRKIKSPESYLILIEDLIDRFEDYLKNNNLISSTPSEENAWHLVEIISYKNSFDSLVILVSLVTLIVSLWLSEFFTNNFVKQLKDKVDKLHRRGLENKRKRTIIVFIPLILDFACFLAVGIVLLIINLITSLNLTLIIIILGIFTLLFIFKSYKKYNNSKQLIINTKSIFFYVIILLIVSITPLLLSQFIYALIPDDIFSYIVLFSQTIQYFIISLLITEIFIKKISKNLYKKSGVRNLINKLINKKESNFRLLVHTTLLLVWGTSVVTGSFQTFYTNYNLNIEIEHPTDLVVSTDLYLFNISLVENNASFSQVFSISQTQENFFVQYDLYLMDFSVISELIQNIKKSYGFDELKEGITYMSKDFADNFNFVNGDYFPTKMGYNGTSVYVEQEIQIVDYFPFVKRSNNRPFIISSYNELYNNISKVSKLYMNLDDDISKKEAINYLEQQFETTVQEIEETLYVDYKSFILIFQFYFILITTITIWLNIRQLLADIENPMRVFYQRGMSSKLIKLRQFSSLSISLLISVLLGVSLGILYIRIQLPTAVYTTSQYLPIKYMIWYSLLFVPLIPIIYGLTIITQRKITNELKG